MTGSEPKNKKADNHLKYGEGQREAYGEGYANRPENVTEGAQDSADHDWAGGDHDEQEQAPTDRAPGGRPEKHEKKP